jgi:hypothetical protein
METWHNLLRTKDSVHDTIAFNFVQSLLLLRSLFFQPIFIRADDIDGSGVERGFDVHRAIFLDHPDTRATVLSDLIDVSSLH